MVVFITGVVKLAPVPRSVDPAALAYQLYVASPPEAVNTVLPGPQSTKLPLTAGADGEGFTVIVIVAQLGLNCPPLLLLTKYVVVVFGLTVNVAPVPT